RWRARAPVRQPYFDPGWWCGCGIRPCPEASAPGTPPLALRRASLPHALGAGTLTRALWERDGDMIFTDHLDAALAQGDALAGGHVPCPRRTKPSRAFFP